MFKKIIKYKVFKIYKYNHIKTIIKYKENNFNKDKKWKKK